MIIERIQGRLFCGFSLAALVLPIKVNWILGSALILILGVPHGAFDSIYFERLFRPSHRASWLLFVLLYLMTSALVVGFWVVAPFAALSIFLLISLWHFSADPAPGVDAITRLFYGGGIIVLPLLRHSAEVTRIFTLLSGPDAAGVIVVVLHQIAPAWALFLGIAALLQVRRDLLAAAEITALGVLGIFAPPLVAFAVFFCAMHSARHLIRTVRWSGVPFDRSLLMSAALPMFILIPFLALGWYLLDGLSNETRAIRILFIGLAALTVPHMALVERERVRLIGNTIT